MSSKPILDVKRIRYAVREFEILKQVSITVEPGEFVGIIGPNGSGKSTLLKNIYKVLTPTGGDIFVKGHNLAHITNRQMAREIAVVAQENNTSFDFSVEEVVSIDVYKRQTWSTYPILRTHLEALR